METDTAAYHTSAAHREARIAERHRLGHDRKDEVWEGVYVMSPAALRRHGRLMIELALILSPPAKALGLYPISEFNLGHRNDFRIPDMGFLRTFSNVAFETGDAAIVVEVLSPDDGSFKKFGFYFRHGVDEILIVDPRTRRCDWYVRGADGFEPAQRSPLLGVTAAELDGALPWEPE